MIGRIKGILIKKQPPDLLVDVNGLGYELHASMNTIYRIPDEGSEIVLYTHLFVREDALTLYGFYDEEERRLFKALIKISGVGAKTSLAILSSIEPKDFLASISREDLSTLVRIPGIGRKTAERLIIEMRDVISKWKYVSESSKASGNITSSCLNDNVYDATCALVALGFKQQDVSRAISKIVSDNNEITTESLIKIALKNMTR
jgi:Holliday junction DNA helicase RuvA